MNWSLFLLRNISKEKIYWEGNGSILIMVNNSLHD